MKRARRVISHHGSDCPDGPHPFKAGRCIILTRVDWPDQPGRKSEAWVSGDCAETCSMQFKRENTSWYNRSESDEPIASERLYRKRHTFDATKPVWYGGGFWQRVSIEPQVTP